MAKSTAMPTNRMPKPTETRLSVPTAAAANSSVSISPSPSVSKDRHDQPPGLHREEQPERDQHHAASQADHRAFDHGGEFLVRQRHLPGDAHPRLARLHELQPGDDLAHRLGRRAAGLQRAEIEFWLDQHEPVLAGEIVQPAAQQHLPRQRARMAGQHVRHRQVERVERGEIGAEIDIALGGADAQQRQRREQAARGRIGDQLAEERLRVDGPVHQVRQRLLVDEQQPLPAQERRRVGPAHRVEMDVIAAQRIGQRGGRGIRLLRLLGVDHRHQQAAELRESPS